MKNNILKFTLGLVLLFVVGITFGQTQTAPAKEQSSSPAKPMTNDERADKQLKKLTERLTLTNDQQPKVRAILMSSLQQEEADKKTANGDMAKLKELNTKRDEKRKIDIKAILTPKQLEIYNTPVARPNPKPKPKN